MEADAPLFKRKKSRPTRIRDAQSPDPENQNAAPDTPAEAEDSPMTLAAKLKAKQKARAKPQARLSFGVEEEDSGETFKVKKSALSLKMKAGNASPHVAHISTPTPPVADTPSYTADYLKELRAANAASRPRPPQDSGETPMDVETYNADELAAMGLEEVFAESASGATIPGGATVLEAKKKRERLRAIGAPNATAAPSEEFISLSLTKRPDDEDDGTPGREGRLEREEDDLGDGEDELAEYTGAKERIALGKKAKKEEAKRRRAGMAEMIEDVEQDDDEETKEWEKTQIRRIEGPEKAKGPEKAVYKPAPIPTTTAIPNLGSSIAALAANLSALTTSHTQNTTALNNLADERNALEVKEANLRQMIEAAEARRAWFKDMREWVESIADFLDTKFPQLEKLEEEHVSLMSERYGMISKRRAEDDEDDACLFLNLPEKPQDANEPEMDELGRVRPSMSQGRHAPVRKARRADRERRHAAKKSSNEEGYSTDSSLGDADAEDFETAIGSLRQRVSGLLSDVQLKDFKDARLAVAGKFSEWRKLYGDSYSGAWGGLGAVSAWEFWARLEMVGWDPLHEEVARSLDSFKWYSGLYEYSRPKGDSSGGMEVDDEDEEPPLGPDGDLVNSMVSTAVIPRLTALVSGGELDPYSARDVRRLIDLAEQLEVCVPRTDVKFLAFLQAATRIFRDAVTSTYDLVKPGIDSAAAPAFDPAALHARIRFLTKRLKLLTMILRWRKFVGELFGIGEMAQRLIKDVMLPIALGGWDVGGREIILKVVKALPVDLAVPELSAQMALAS